MKDLIIRLLESDVVCFLLGEYAGCVFYGDDIILFSASFQQLRMMLDICTPYVDDNDLLYWLLYDQHVNLNSLDC